MRRVIAVVLGLALVLAGLDFAARAAAQAAVARQVQTSEGLARQPVVEISGVPFLLQAVSGVYQRVDVQLREVPAGGDLQLEALDARLTGVHLPLSALFAATPTDTPVDAARVTARISFAALDAQVAAVIRSTFVMVHFSDAGGGRLGVSVRYTGLGGPLTLSGTAKPAIDRGKLTIGHSEDTLAQIPEPFRASVTRLLTPTVALPGLPFGLVPTSVAVTAQGVTVTADARGTVLPAEPRS